MTWEELGDKISKMTKEERRRNVAIWADDFFDKDCSLQITDEALYFHPDWGDILEKGEFTQEDLNNPRTYKVCEEGTYYILVCN